MIKAMKIAVAAAVMGSTMEATPQPIPAVNPKPNFVVILTDDMSVAEYALMPNVQQLLRDQGMDFANAAVSFSLCCPSRTTMFTGQYAHNHGIKSNVAPLGGYSAITASDMESRMLPKWLQNAGYFTSYTGKYFNEYPQPSNNSTPPGWSDWHALTAGTGSDFDFLINDNGIINGGDGTYITDLLVNRAATAIDHSRSLGMPFYVQLSTTAPHLPALPAPRHADMFPEMLAPRSPNFNEEDVSDKPTHIREAKPLTIDRVARLDRVAVQRAQSLQAIDEGVAALVEHLAAIGEIANTHIIFTSDNGFHLGNHRLLAGKQTAYEEDTLVPLTWRGPGVLPGTANPLPIVNIDFAPTIAELAGATPLVTIDGRSIASALRGEELAGWRDTTLLEKWATPSGPIYLPPSPGFSGLRTDQHTFVSYATGELELYDRQVDPFQLENIAATSPELIAQFSHQLALLEKCEGASCRDLEMMHIAATTPTPVRQISGAAAHSVLAEGTSYPSTTAVTLTTQFTTFVEDVVIAITGPAELSFPSSITLPRGSTSIAFDVSTRPDARPEANVMSVIELSTMSGAAVLGEGVLRLQLEVIDDDATCTIVGTPSDDVLTGTPEPDVICGYAGNDVIEGAAGADILIGGTGDDVISGGDGNDVITGGSGSDAIQGGDGDDELIPGSRFAGDTNVDAISGDAGIDGVNYAGGPPVTVDLMTGVVTGQSSDTLLGVENVTGSEFDDVLVGSPQANVLDGGGGDDLIDGQGGDDVLTGGSNHPVSTLTYDAAATLVRGDVLRLSQMDWARVNLVAGTVRSGLGVATISGFETVIGTGGPDVIFGNDENNLVYAGGGNDFVRAGGGDDLVDGGEGDDQLHGEGGFDGVRGDAGLNWLYGQTQDDVLVGNDVDVFHGAGGNNRCTRNGVAVVIVGCTGIGTRVYWPGTGPV